MKISLCASAVRPNFWKECYDSLTQNDIEWELIFCGPNPPTFEAPNFIYVPATVKPAQCYEIAFRMAHGELLGWTADDTTYPPHALDKMYEFWKSFNDEKIVTAFRTVEDGRDITNVHRFKGRDSSAPVMAPFGIMQTSLFHQLGGYDKRFICGQSENDVVMRVYEIGGDVKISDIPVYVHHEKAHSSTVFRSNNYVEDRRVLEGCWMDSKQILKKRLSPVQSFEDTDDIQRVTQGQKGQW